MATMVNKTSNRLVRLLVYAFLEWLLISLLLLNSLFGYLISKFASRFGLQKPCLWCSRVDRLLEDDTRNRNSYTDLVCEAHAAEISRLRFCSAHKRLAGSGHMCWDCSVGSTEEDCGEVERFFSRCCRCCGAKIGREGFLIDAYSILGPSWGISEIARIGDLDRDERVSDKMLNLVTSVDNNGYEVAEEDEEEVDRLSSSSMFICYEKEAMECSKMGSLDDGSVRQISQSGASIVQCRSRDDHLIEDISSWFGQNLCDQRLIPVELIDLSTITELRIESKLISKSAAEDSEMEMMSGFGDQCQVTESEEMINKHELVRKESEQVLTTEEVHTLQINVKKAVMTKLNDISGSECESADKDFFSSNDIGLNHREKEKLPDTPTSMISEKMEQGENGDLVSTVEQLRMALRSERKALIALYAELEEERSASAVAASETLAMITRLQEEKAAVQMEAVQYQRMMEEQSEYDLEALQLLNDLMVKREREKQELERELETYRKKVIEYEEERDQRAPSSSSWDGGDEFGDETVACLEEMAVECESNVGILGESLTKFKEERLESLGGSCNEEEDEKEKRACDGLDSMAKKLLPFLDEAAESESEERAESECGRIAIEEEVDRVYERLQALEADREFLKNCVGSIKNGDRGLDLLHEILQHLRDLRAVELRMSVANGEDLGVEVSDI